MFFYCKCVISQNNINKMKKTIGKYFEKINSSKLKVSFRTGINIFLLITLPAVAIFAYYQQFIGFSNEMIAKHLCISSQSVYLYSNNMQLSKIGQKKSADFYSI